MASSTYSNRPSLVHYSPSGALLTRERDVKSYCHKAQSGWRAGHGTFHAWIRLGQAE